MIIAYVLSAKKTLKKVEINLGKPLPKGIVWVDLLDPSIEEEKFLEKALKIDAPTREEMDKIEVLSPFYKERESYYMTVTALHKTDKDYPECTALIFILNPRCLVTLRYSRFKAFNYFSNRALRNPEMCETPDAALEGLLESMVHSIADTLEKTGNENDQLLVDVFEIANDDGKLNEKKKKEDLPGSEV